MSNERKSTVSGINYRDDLIALEKSAKNIINILKNNKINNKIKRERLIFNKLLIVQIINKLVQEDLCPVIQLCSDRKYEKKCCNYNWIECNEQKKQKRLLDKYVKKNKRKSTVSRRIYVNMIWEYEELINHMRGMNTFILFVDKKVNEQYRDYMDFLKSCRENKELINNE